MDRARPIGSNSGEEVLRFMTVNDVLQLLAIASEEDRTRARSIPYADHITLQKVRTIWRWCKRLVVPPMARGLVCDRSLVEA